MSKVISKTTFKRLKKVKNFCFYGSIVLLISTILMFILHLSGPGGSPFLGISFLFGFLFVPFQFIHWQLNIRLTKIAYDYAKQALKESPGNSTLRQEALEKGRAYYATTGASGADAELAIQNDLDAVDRIAQ